MGNDEAETPYKSEKAASPVQEQTNSHVYPDWAAIQAYYGPGVTLPPPYFNSAVPSGHAPHAYMWAPHQAMMPPYGTPYAAIYSHGGIYAHPSVPLGSHSHGHMIPSSPVVSEAMVVTPLSIETPAKSSGNKDQGLMKKLKGFDGLAVTVSNGNAESAVGSVVPGLSQSVACGTEGSSDGSNGNTSGGDQAHKKRSSKGMQSAGKDEKVDKPVPGGEANATSRAFGIMVAPISLGGKSVEIAPSSSVIPALEFRGSPGGKANTTALTVPSAPDAVMPVRDSLHSEPWTQDDRELKRERRKQSNRESARRSRLRKQAESEELALKVESLNAENIALKSELNRFEEKSENLRLENVALKEKLKNLPSEEIVSDGNEAQKASPISTENFLSMVNNSGSVNRSTLEENENHENSNSGAKLHQLLDSSPRADPVAAG